MGVKGAKNKKQQEKWNKFVSLLIKFAGLPSTCLVRLTFKNSEGITYDINNYDDLKQLSKQYGVKNDEKYIQMNISIEVLALTFSEYQKRFKYEKEQYMIQNMIKAKKNNKFSPKQKQQLSKFVLPPLIITNAIIQKKFQIKKLQSQSPSINIMDMLHVNQNQPDKKQQNESNPVLNDLLKNIVHPNQSHDEPEKKVDKIPQIPPIPQIPNTSVLESVATSINKSNKHALSTIYGKYPLMSFEELRHKHYVDHDEWSLVSDNKNNKNKNKNKNNKLIILNWPSAMNKETLKTIFSPYGDIIGCEVNDEESMIEYVEEESLERAITALHGFHIGTHRLSVQLLKNEVQTESKEEEAKVEEKEENRKLVVGNWPIAMGEGLLSTLFSPYGELKEAKIVNECAFVEYNTKEDAEKAYNALNGFQMGANKLVVSFASDEISHILSMNNNGNINRNININEEPVQIIPEIDEEEYENSENSGEFEIEIEIENNKELVDEFQRIGYPVNDDMEAMEAIIEVVEINNDDDDNDDNESPLPLPLPPPPVRKKSIFEQDEENENENENETENMQHLQSTENIELELENKSNEKERERVENEQETPNENDIEQMVLKENDKEIQQMYANEHNKIVQDAFNAEQFIDSNKHKKTMVIIQNENEQDSSSRSESDDNTDSDSLISFESDSSFDDSSDSEKEKEKLKRKSSKKKLSKKQLKKLKKKQRRKKKRKMRKRKEKKKLAQREKYVDKNILALNECLDKFTNLMSSVSQSAMVMQQSVAQISQIHAQQQQQSIMYQQSMNGMHGGSIFPNQPMYTSIISNANMPNINNTTQTQIQTQTQPGTSNDNTQIQSQSQSIQNIITQLSQTQGAPDNNAKTMSASPNINKPTPVNNANMLNQQQQQILLNQQLLQQQQQMMYNNNNNNKANAWIQSNFGKPTLNTNVNNNNNNIRSSPILHSTQIMLNNNNAMNLSGDSNTEIQPGNMSSNPSKSKIFEHKKALRNVSKEMDEKLNALNEMGYKNRTFNLVLLKQENGDMDKVIENLKKFYENN